MSQDAKDYRKPTVAVVVILLGFVAWHFIRKSIDPTVLDRMGRFGDVALMGVAALAALAGISYVFFNLFREVFTQSILERAEKILQWAPDHRNEFLYVATDCHQSGDDGSPGFSIYLHYLIELKTGKTIRYNANRQERADREAIVFFSERLNRSLSVSPSRATPAAPAQITAGQFRIQVRPFKTRFDFGFEITCTEKNGARPLWRRKV